MYVVLASKAMKTMVCMGWVQARRDKDWSTGVIWRLTHPGLLTVVLVWPTARVGRKELANMTLGVNPGSFSGGVKGSDQSHEIRMFLAGRESGAERRTSESVKKDRGERITRFTDLTGTVDKSEELSGGSSSTLQSRVQCQANGKVNR